MKHTLVRFPSQTSGPKVGNTCANHDFRISSFDHISLVSLAAPIFMQNFLAMLMGSVNTMMLGHYSDQAVGAVGVANQYINMLLMIYSVTSSGTGIVISQYLGAKNYRDSAKVSMVALILNSVLGVFLSIAFIFLSRPMAGLMHISPGMIQDATVYLQIVGGSSVLQALVNSMFVISLSYGKAVPPMCIALMMNVINVFGDYLIIFRPIPIPFYGVSGVASVQAFSSLCACVMMGCMLSRINTGMTLRGMKQFPKDSIIKILRVGIPAGTEGLSYNLSQIASTFIITLIGTFALTTKIYVQNIVFFVYVFSLSIGQASQILTGRLIGAKMVDEADRLNRHNLKVAASLNFLLSVCILLLSRLLLGLFTKDPKIIAIGVDVMMLDVLLEVGRAFNHVESNSLRGTGDAKYCMIVSVCSTWGVSVILSYILGVLFHLGLVGVWIAFGTDEWCRGMLLINRWWSKKWITKSLVAE